MNMETRLRRIVTPDMVSLWIPSGTDRARDIIRGNHGQCYGTHPNVPVISEFKPPNLLADGGLNIWTSPTNPTHWTAGSAGDSTVNREATEKVEGAFSCRLDVDGEGNLVYASQNFSMTPLKQHRIIVWYQNSVAGKTGQPLIYDAGANVYLQAGGTWGPAPFTLSSSAIWKRFKLDFIAHPDYSNYFIQLKRFEGASFSIYFDNVSIEELTPSLINPSVGWVFGGDDYVDCGNDKSLDITDEVAFGMWMMIQDVPMAYPGIIGKEGSYTFQLDNSSTTPYLSIYCSGGADWLFIASPVSINTFVFLGGTYKSSDGKMKVFLNGSLNGEKTHTFGGNIVSTANAVQLGKVIAAFLSGCTAFSFVANKAWSEAQFKNFYLSTKGMFAPRG